MDFTNDELYQIEVLFDKEAGQHVANTALLLKTLGCQGEKNVVNWMGKVIDEQVNYYDLCRTISTKCQMIRNGEDK